MDKLADEDRVDGIFRMIMEMAGGNFAGRISRTRNVDELEALGVLTNWLAEELHGSYFHMGFVNPRTDYRYGTRSILVLDTGLVITDASPDFIRFSGYGIPELRGLALVDLLARESRLEWDVTLGGSVEDIYAGPPKPVMLIGHGGTPLSAYLTLSPLAGNSAIIASLYSSTGGALKDAPAIHLQAVDFVTKYTYDPRLMQKVHDHILANMDSKLPTLRGMARLFGTNEFKLKNGFKQLYGCTIQQFYNGERLNRAQLLIAHTIVPLKNIAHMGGFSTYPNFSRAFKIRFGYSPSDVKRPDRQGQDGSLDSNR
ncbi:helix-turn-helix transcriptional regulator [Flavobacterium macacae]|uniref:AraC family transcriptional regulator n=1 Tax=Flavobacterium macacae TaxID=2488993 RepID=A0A3P3WDY0_9FLAO|nr:AraC family transcriptional regulator [Flavobacterium macacae]RRJ90763.1 AraC family transcriptional regulator [Flavobacterium macacae]